MMSFFNPLKCNAKQFDCLWKTFKCGIFNFQLFRCDMHVHIYAQMYISMEKSVNIEVWLYFPKKKKVL